MKISDHTVGSFEIVQMFGQNAENITSIDFSFEGRKLISAEDNQIVIHDCEGGKSSITLGCKKYGLGLLRFTRERHTVIHSSTKVDDNIRYLSLYGNQYIRYFTGHTKNVISLCVSRINDTFISGSLDQTLRLWDLRESKCRGILHLPGPPVAALDPKGNVFATGVNSESIRLYDMRCFEKGSFASFRPGQDTECNWTGLKFSRNRKTILVSTNGSIVRLVDANKGTPLHTFTGHLNNKGIPIEASLSPDSQFVFSGSTDGRVHVWNAKTGGKACVLKGTHTGPVQCVQFNPKYMMLASADKSMFFWHPAVDEAKH